MTVRHLAATLAIALALALAPVTAEAALTTFVENFENESNVGAWTFGNVYDKIEMTGGNPGAFLHNDYLDTIGPQPRTTLGVESVFTGNYEERGVTAVGIDLVLFDVDFTSVQRPVTLILYSDAGTPDDTTDDCKVYRKGTKTAPAPNGKWATYSFQVPSGSDGLPRGWVVWQCGDRAEDEAWELVIEDVDRLSFFWGDPELFFIFQMWDVGMDNPRITYGDEEPEE